MIEKTKTKTDMQKFRRQNPRYDYYPTADAAEIIERLRKANPKACFREILDALVEKGGKVFFPERANTTVGTRK